MYRFDKNVVQQIIGLTIISFSLIFSIFTSSFRFVDDAWITFRYAHNFAYYGQLTFNIGERVEGITNLLWAIILAPQIRFIPLSVVDIAIINSLVFTFLSLYMIWRIGVFLELDPVVASLPPSILILSPSFYGATTIGLEAPLFSLLLTGVVYSILRERYSASSLLCALLFLTRPESLALGLAFLFFLIQPFINHEHELKIKLHFLGLQTKEGKFNFLFCNFIFLGVVAAATSMRLMYYHDFIPNSLRAKFVQFTPTIYKESMDYIKGFLEGNPHFVLMVLGVLVFFLIKGALSFYQTGLFQIGLQNPRGQVILFCFVAIFWSIVIAIRGGGDWMPYYRLLSQYGVLYVILILTWLKEILSVKKAATWVLLVFMIFPLLQSIKLFSNRLATHVPLLNVYYTPGFSFWDETAEKLTKAPLLSTDVVSAEGIGYISYSLIDVRMHDPLGLSERFIARYGISASPFGKKNIKYTVTKIHPSVMIWQYVGHLRNLDLAVVDNEYITYCHDYCDHWGDADIVMIRKDRAEDISPYFDDWKKITLQSLFAGAE